MNRKYEFYKVSVIDFILSRDAKDSIYFFTDEDDLPLQIATNFHLINTKCGKKHKHQDLCCKMQQEYRGFRISQRKWWCHFDDDNYVNVHQLVKLLQV